MAAHACFLVAASQLMLCLQGSSLSAQHSLTVFQHENLQEALSLQWAGRAQAITPLNHNWTTSSRI
eukprot:2484246-Amphidinium_carterae.1